MLFSPILTGAWDFAESLQGNPPSILRGPRLVAIGLQWLEFLFESREMKLNTLMYHDVITSFETNCSGFEGEDAGRYKMTEEMFSRHLDALARNLDSPPTLIEGTDSFEAPEGAWALTFDDGGVSALRAADLLEARNWRGHFFVTTDYVDRKFFLNRNQIRELRERGHVVGSHSCSHPRRMADHDSPRLLIEWRDSIRTIEDILGERVAVASVPGGYYNRTVAAAAALAGITHLFNSQPTGSRHFVGSCCVMGRYVMMRTTSPRTAVALASGNTMSCGLRRSVWGLKNMARRCGGARYEMLRDFLIRKQ